MSTPAPSLATPPLDRFQEELLASGMDEESVAFFIGRLSQEALTMAVSRAKDQLGSDWATIGGIVDEQVQLEAFQELYEKKTGSSFLDLLGECIEQLVQEFEAQE